MTSCITPSSPVQIIDVSRANDEEVIVSYSDERTCVYSNEQIAGFTPKLTETDEQAALDEQEPE